MEYNQDQLSLLTAAAEHIAAINLEIAELEEQKQELLSVFKNEQNGMVPRKEAYDFGKVEVKVSENTRLDDGLARTQLTARDYKAASKVTLDTSLARRVLTADKLEKITKKYANKIEVRLK